VALGLVAVALLGCAATLPPPPVPALEARQAPEDADLEAVVPTDAEVMLTLDLAALRVSPWTRSVVAAGGAEGGGSPRGFDPVADVDRLVLVRLPADATGISLSIARGRFDRAKVKAALGAGGQAVTTSAFRGCTLWISGGEATAFLTDRTLLTGALASVRAAIDTAYGRARDIRGQAWLAEVRRRFGQELPPAAAELAVRVSDEMRDRLRDEMVEAGGLETLAARVELGKRLDIAVVGATGTRQQANALIARVGATLRDLQTRPSLVALGFGPVLAGVQLAVQGPRVAAELRLRERDRDQIALRLSAVARLVAQARATTSESRP
jgi:hypothetical protein